VVRRSKALDKKVRGKEKEVREKVIFIRATKEEYKEITERAQYTDMTPSRYLISCGLNQKIKMRKSKKATGQDREELEELMWQLKKLGRNVNQLAHCYEDRNLTGEGVISQNEINQVGEKIKSLLKQLEGHL
jgi:hypothetical protein